MGNRSSKNEGIQANSVQADVIAVGQNAKAQQNKYVNASEASQKQLDDLLVQLKEALAQVPPDRSDDAQAVTALTEELVQSGKQEKPNPKLLEIKGESLKAAAQNLAAVMPTVLAIATQIVGHILAGPH
jgi:hypothetical protein